MEADGGIISLNDLPSGADCLQFRTRFGLLCFVSSAVPNGVEW